jgi:methylase of polypeptide subunit release factors
MHTNFEKELFSEISRIYIEMRNRPFEVRCIGLKLKSTSDVYAPDMFSDSAYFATELPKIVGQKSLLEIGTGTGIIGISCALNGANVVATDINLSAVKVAMTNIKTYSKKIEEKNGKMEVFHGDVYDMLALKEKEFDFIFWSHPYNNWPEPVTDMLLRSGRDHNYVGLLRYITGAKKHLKPDGKLLLGTGTTADIETIVQDANETNYSMRVFTAKQMPLAVGSGIMLTNMIVQFDKK